MLFDPAILIDQPLRVLTVIAVIVIGKTLVAFILVLALGYPLNTALTISASLAQIGELSFILAGLGVSLSLLPVDGQNLILAGALLSIALNPFVFRGLEPAAPDSSKFKAPKDCDAAGGFASRVAGDGG